MRFLFTGMPVSSEEKDSPAIDSVVDAIRIIFDKHMSDIRAAAKKYEESKDLETLTYDLLPVRNKILYEAYAPYWLLHCRQIELAESAGYNRQSGSSSLTGHPTRMYRKAAPRDSVSEFTYYNDLIDMYWAWKRQAWMSEDGGTTVMLPPTGGLIALAQKAAAANLENYIKNQQQ